MRVFIAALMLAGAAKAGVPPDPGRDAPMPAGEPIPCWSSRDAFDHIADLAAQGAAAVERGDHAGGCAAVRRVLKLMPDALAAQDACLADALAHGVLTDAELRQSGTARETFETFRDEAATLFPQCGLDPLAE